MCHFHNDLPTIEDGEDQYILDTPVLRDFIAAVNTARASAPNDAAAMEEIRPHFAALLADPGWLPPEYQEPATQSGMGANTGMWLLYRAGDGSLAFSALVLAPGRETPVHDHLAWGLVGLYRGEQDEIVYQRRDDGARDDYADLDVAERHALMPGDFYTLLPENDIHRIVRRQYVPDEKIARPFRSGYVNVICAEGEARATPTWDDVHESLERLAV